MASGSYQLHMEQSDWTEFTTMVQVRLQVYIPLFHWWHYILLHMLLLHISGCNLRAAGEVQLLYTILVVLWKGGPSIGSMSSLKASVCVYLFVIT